MRRLQPRQSRPMGVLWERQWERRGVPEKGSMAEREKRALACSWREETERERDTLRIMGALLGLLISLKSNLESRCLKSQARCLKLFVDSN